MRRLIGISILLFLMIGCASTKMQSVMNYPEGNKLTKILLFVPISNLITRQEVENAIMKEFDLGKTSTKYPLIGKKKTVKNKYAWMDSDTLAVLDTILYNCSDIAPLWDELSPDELDSILTPFGFDGTLIVTPGEYWTTSTYIPKSTYYDVNFKTTNTDYQSKTNGRITEYSVGGYTVNIPHWHFDTRIYDFDDGRLIWKATSLSSGTKWDRNLKKSYAKKLHVKLQDDLIIPHVLEVSLDN